MRRILTPAVVILLALTACGSGDTSDEAATTAAPPTEASTTTAPTAEASTNVASSPEDREYCRHSRAADLLDEEFDAYDDPVALEGYFIELNSLLTRAIAVAPPEVATDLGIIHDQVIAVGTSTFASDYEFSAMLAAIEANTNETTDAAFDAVNGFDNTFCDAAS